MAETVVVTGATGKIGGMLRKVWTGRADTVLTARNPSDAGMLAWDLPDGTPPPLPAGAVILHLAGTVRGSAAELASNTALALAVCRAAKAAKAAHVFVASTAAVYGPQSGDGHEDDAPDPPNPYGLSKAAMERAVLGWQRATPGAPGVTILRIGNVVGADALLGRAATGAAITLDCVPGQAGGPIRSYIGPRTLAHVLRRLAAMAEARAALPDILNVVQAPPLPMGALLDAAGIRWQYGPPNPGAAARVVLANARLLRLMPVDPADPVALVREWRGLTDDPG